ncbi:MAG: hypothetical protein HDR28_12300 [Lachnospiraceae bacterium]|nr:hypothetical protein [Lachnospiraceae bacterium]
MSIYVGKSMDTFEDVWNMWMRHAGVVDYIHADVLSFRCFAFSCGEDIKRWFSPVQSTQMAFVELCSNLGIEKVCSIIPASDWDGRLSELKWPVLLADVYLDVEGAVVREQFYHGTPPFFLLYRHSDGKHLVYASPRTPFIELSEEQVKDRISGSKGYVIIGRMPMRIQLPSAREIIHKGMQWRKNAGNNKEGLEYLCSDGYEKIQDRFSCVSVQYGLKNYQIQLSKVIRFCAQEMRISDSEIDELNSVLLRIPPIYKKQTYEEIARIDEDFWALIEKIEENYYV